MAQQIVNFGPSTAAELTVDIQALVAGIFVSFTAIQIRPEGNNKARMWIVYEDGV